MAPTILGEESVVSKKTEEKTFYCNKYDSLYLCNIKSGDEYFEKMFTAKPSKDKSIMKINNDNDKENILVKGRVAIYSYMSVESSYVHNETCQGFYISKEQRAKLRIYDLSLGLKNIYDSMDKDKKDE